jgi:hypothetical protein
MTPVEIIALVLIALAAVKIILLPKIWMKVVKFLYSRAGILFLVELILAGLVLYYLLQSLTIVQILAVIAFGALLTGLSFAWYGKETLAWARTVLKKGMWKKAWLPILIWLALIVWGALALFKVI